MIALFVFIAFVATAFFIYANKQRKQKLVKHANRLSGKQQQTRALLNKKN